MQDWSSLEDDLQGAGMEIYTCTLSFYEHLLLFTHCLIQPLPVDIPYLLSILHNLTNCHALPALSIIHVIPYTCISIFHTSFPNYYSTNQGVI